MYTIAISFSRFVKSTNMKKKTYNVALNHLADLSSEELKKMRGYRNTGFNAKQLYVPRVKDIPSFINWRLRGNACYKTIFVLYVF